MLIQIYVLNMLNRERFKCSEVGGGGGGGGGERAIMVHIKYPLLLIEKNSPCSGSSWYHL